MRTELDRLAGGAHHDPHSVLGAHPVSGRGPRSATLRPLAERVAWCWTTAPPHDMKHQAHGVFETTVQGSTRSPSYTLSVRVRRAPSRTRRGDPYRHRPTLGEVDLHLIGEGRHERLWEVLGARVTRTRT